MSGFDSINSQDSYQAEFIYQFPRIVSRRRLLELIFSEHTYAKPFSLDPDFNRTHSTRVLLFSRAERKLFEGHEDARNEEIEILEDEKPEEPLVSYDKSSAKEQFSELEECFETLLKEESWQEEDNLSRAGWSRDQSKLYDQVVKLLSTYQLARCTYEGNESEEILRHVAMNKAAKRFRNVAAGVTWDAKVMSWLHSMLIDGLNPSLFLCYLELLQALIAKVPSLVENMMINSTPRGDRNSILKSASIMNCLKKPLDPTPAIKSKRDKEKKEDSFQETVAENIENKAENKIENKPLLLMLPRGPALNLMHPKRFMFWKRQLSNAAKTSLINVHTPDIDTDLSSTAYLENIIGVTRTRVSLVHAKIPGRPVILLGWSIGALLACQVSLLDNVAAVVCLGYPCYGLDGLREIESDPCVDAKCPVMFVIGTHSSTCSTEYVEALREKMRVDTNLLVVPGGDEVLKLSSSHKKRIKMTQNMVDQLIMDEVEDFIKSLHERAEKLKEAQRPNTPSTAQQLKAEKKRKHKKLEAEKEVVERKKKKVSPAAQKPLVIGKRDQTSMIYDPSRARLAAPGSFKAGDVDINGGLMTPSELTKAATRNLASNASPVGRGKKLGLSRALAANSPSIISSLMSTHPIKDPSSVALPKIGRPAIGRPLKNPHGKMNEKMIKKLKVNKKQTPMPRPFSPHHSHNSNMASIQQLPSPSSIVLSSSGAQVRLQDGRILYVAGSDSRTSGSQVETSAISSSLRSSLLARTSPSVGYQPSNIHHSSAFHSSNIPSSTPLSQQPHVPCISSSSMTLSKPVLSPPSTGFKNFATNASAASSSEETTSTNTDLITSSPFSTPASLNTALASSTTIMQTTQLTPTDLKYLARFFQQTSHDSSTVKSGDAIMSDKVQDKGASIPKSPISAKIGIGTLTNLPNSDGSPPGSGTRASPSSKQLPPSDAPIPPLPEAPKMKALLSKTHTAASKVQPFPKRDLFDLKKSSTKNRNSPKNLPGVPNVTSQINSLQTSNALVTATMPAHGSSRGTNSATSTKSHINPTVLKSGVDSRTKPSSVAQQRKATSSTSSNQNFSTGKTASEMSQIIRKVTPASSGVLDSANHRNLYNLSSSSKLTVAGRSIQSSPLSNKKTPQTITLHIPNSAVLKDSGKSGSEIKLIGLLNQKGKSPMSSPIQFSVQNKSAPGSPQSQSPTIVISSKSDQPASKSITQIDLDPVDGAPTNSNPKDSHAADSSVSGTSTSTAASNQSTRNAPIAAKDTKTSAVSKDTKVGVRDNKSVINKPSYTTASMAISRKLKQAVKFTKPTTIQTALIKSLTAASLSPQQQESITALLKNQGMKTSANSPVTNATKSLTFSTKSLNRANEKIGGLKYNQEAKNVGLVKAQTVKSLPRHVADIDVVNGHVVGTVKDIPVVKNVRPSLQSTDKPAVVHLRDNENERLAALQIKGGRPKVASPPIVVSVSETSGHSDKEESTNGDTSKGNVDSQNRSKNVVLSSGNGRLKELNASVSKLEAAAVREPFSLRSRTPTVAASKDSSKGTVVDNQADDGKKNRDGLHLELNNGRDDSHTYASSLKFAGTIQKGRKRSIGETASVMDGMPESKSEDDAACASKIAKKASTPVNDIMVLPSPQKTEE